MQKTVAIRNKAEGLLLRIIGLEERFHSLPGDVAELNRRDKVIEYAIKPPVVLDADVLSGNSRVSKDDSGLILKSLSKIAFKTTGKFLGSSKIYRRPSSITRLVRDPGTVANANAVNRWHGRWPPTSKGVNK